MSNDRRMLISHRTAKLMAAATLLVCTSIQAQPRRFAQSSSTISTLQRTAISALRVRTPDVLISTQDAMITHISATQLEHGASPIDSARRFTAKNAGVFGVTADQLVAREANGKLPHVLPISYDKTTQAYRFTMITFDQRIAGLPVNGGELRTLVRNEPDFPLVLASSSLRPIGDFQPSADQIAHAVDLTVHRQLQDATLALLRADNTDWQSLSPPHAVVWAGDEVAPAAPTLAIVFDAVQRDQGQLLDKRRIVVEIVSGAILRNESHLHTVDVSGQVDALSTPRDGGADICVDSVMTPMRDAAVALASTTVYTDSDGAFVIPYGGAGLVTVESPVAGRWFTVTDYTGPDDLLSTNVLPPGPVQFLHNAADLERSLAAANAYIFANEVREFALAQNLLYPTLMNPSFAVYVNRIDVYCPGNAWYDSFYPSINFCLASAPYPNSAFASVVYHEFGHHLISAAGSGQGQYGEGMSDVISVLMLDDPRLGIGFFGDCQDSLRNADNNMQYPCNDIFYGVHGCGTTLAGAVWDTRNELAATHPADYSEILSQLAVNSILLHVGSLITPQITLDFLTLDDDDGDLLNGTPHFREICAGFEAHNLDCPQFDTVRFDYPAGQADVVEPLRIIPLTVDITPATEQPIPGSERLNYRTGSTGPFVAVNVTSIGAGQFQASLPPLACLDRLEYYISVETESGGTTTDPPDAPGNTYFALSAASATNGFVDNFSADLGWTIVNGGGLEAGAWQRGIPAGGGDRGDPEFDFDGDGFCYMTDNQNGNSDVDGGFTTLTSPVVDISGMSNPYVRYARWFSNDSGTGAQTDPFDVEFSTNGGASWTTLEVVGPTASSENPQISGGWVLRLLQLPSANSIQLRFVAQDIGPSSIVEAAVDSFSIVGFGCLPPCAGGGLDLDVDGDTDVIDYEAFSFCLAGPAASSYAASYCDCADSDLDGDVDLADIAELQRQLNP